MLQKISNKACSVGTKIANVCVNAPRAWSWPLCSLHCRG